jgi:type I restriction-modification system DNA methylase subunit
MNNSNQNSRPISVTIDNAFTALKQKLEADAECSVGAFQVMERVNLNAATKYMNLVDASKGLDNDAEYLAETCK